MTTRVECSSPECSTEIIWTLTTNGKRMPVDAAPSKNGSFELDETGETPVARFVPKDQRAGRIDLHESHFSTCVDAGSFRRKG
jgi:hypothetical protein